MTLQEIIKQHIRKKGEPVPFSEFMELALYHPTLGYYSKTEFSDDYYTSPEVHPIFGGILARFFIRQWEDHFQNEKTFFIVELGPGSGRLAEQIIQSISAQSQDCYQKIKYFCVETSPARRLKLDQVKSKFPDRIEIYAELGAIPKKIKGIIFSNEFFDALPFDRITKSGGMVREIFVDDSLCEVLRSPSSATREYLNWLGIEPPEGCVAETHLQSRNWMRTIVSILDQGVILTIDYGHEAGELYSEIRPEGTALCHFHHQTSRNFYDHIGEQDITAHVNFSVLEKAGLALGFQSSPLKTQSEFLLENGLDEIVRTMQSVSDPRSRLKTSSAIKSLIHPEGMGGTFKALVQAKLR